MSTIIICFLKIHISMYVLFVIHSPVIGLSVCMPLILWMIHSSLGVCCYHYQPLYVRSSSDVHLTNVAIDKNSIWVLQKTINWSVESQKIFHLQNIQSSVKYSKLHVSPQLPIAGCTRSIYTMLATPVAFYGKKRRHSWIWSVWFQANHSHEPNKEDKLYSNELEAAIWLSQTYQTIHLRWWLYGY